MKQRQMDRILLGISIGCFFVMSVSFLLMPIAMMQVTPGVLFWLGLITGISLQIVLEFRRKAFFKKYQVKRETMQKPRNGLLSFFSNKEAMIADIVLGVSFVATVLTFMITRGYGIVCYLLVALTVFSFCLHCVFNGRIYFHAKNQIKVRQVLEQKMNSKEKGEGKK